MLFMSKADDLKSLLGGDESFAFYDLAAVKAFVQSTRLSEAEIADRFGSAEGFYEAVFDLRLHALGRLVHSALTTALFAVWAAVVFLVALSEFGTGSGLQLAGNIAAALGVGFLGGGILALLLIMTVGNLAANVTEVILKRRQQQGVAEAWRKLLLDTF